MSVEPSPETSATVVDLATRPDRAELLKEIYSRILIPSFRPDELDPLEVTEAALIENPGAKDVAALVGRDNQVLGAAIGDWDEHSRVYLLSYLAARPGLRNRGVGTQLMRYIPLWWRRHQALLAVAEVDDPRFYPVSDVGDPVARLNFYDRFGAQVLDMSYTQPRVRPGGSRVHGMLLLAFDIRPEALVSQSPPLLKAGILSAFMRDYPESGEDSEADKAEETGILNRLSATAGIAVLPLAQYGEIAIA